MTPLRLALFTDTWPPQVNGVSRTLDRLATEVARRGGEARIVTIADPEAPEDARVERWPSASFWAYPQLRVSAMRPFRAQRLLRGWRPTLVHAATPFGVGLSARRAARALGIPLVTSYHTHFTAYLRHYGLQALDAVGWPFLRWFHNGGRRTFAPTRAVAQELQHHGFAGVRVWGRGVDAHRFSPAHRDPAWRARLGIGADTVLVAYVGRLAPEKGIDVAMAAMRDVLATSGGRVHFALAGDGPAEARLRATAGPGTTFVGRLEGHALAAFYASADVFVFPSVTETFGNVVLEAMASGLAVVAPHHGPTLEFAHEGTAHPCDVRDARALASAVRALVADPARRAALADAARAEALRHSWEAVWEALFAEYREVSAAPSRAARAPD